MHIELETKDMKGQMEDKSRAVEKVMVEISSQRLSLANRSYFGPIVTNMNRRDNYSKAYFDFCRKVLASKRVAIFVFEGAAISLDEFSYEYQPLLTDAIPSIKRELPRLKGEFRATKFLLSLVHRGPQGSSALSQSALPGPSPYLDVTSGEICAEMSISEIEDLIKHYATAAQFALEVGFDGIEIAAGQHSLIRSFLSPLTNQRSDRYGDDRGLLLRSLIREISKSTAGGIVGLRQSIDELAPWGGFGPEQAAMDLIALEQELPGTVSYVLCERGSIYSTADTEADYSAGSLYNSGAMDTFATRVAESLGDDRPLLVDSGGIYTDADLAKLFATDRDVDLIDLTRPIIADPHFLDAIYRPRRCIACNQGCMVGDQRNFPISCAVNASISPDIEAPKRLKERRFPASSRPFAADGPKIAVVGGGVAGMVAALSLARNRHRVTLFEEGPHLGGQLRRYCSTHPNYRLTDLLEDLVTEVALAEIEVELSARVDSYSEVDSFDDVVIATGSNYRPRSGPPIVDIGASRGTAKGQLDSMHVFGSSIKQLIDEGSNFIFYDIVGDEASRAVVKRLIALGAQFTYICPDPVAFSQLSLSNGLVEGNTTLIRSGAELLFEARVTAVEERSCVVEEIYSQHQRVIDFDYFIESNRYFANDQIFRGGRGLLIGDCLAPRSIRSALAEGSRIVEANGPSKEIKLVGAQR